MIAVESVGMVEDRLRKTSTMMMSRRRRGGLERMLGVGVGEVGNRLGLRAMGLERGALVGGGIRRGCNQGKGF